MSKSLGNVLLVRDLLVEAPGEAIRFALLNAHYHQPLDWSMEGLVQAKRALDRLYGELRDLDNAPEATCPPELIAGFMAALEDDLNFPRAIAELDGAAKGARLAATETDRAAYQAALREAGGLLGLPQQDPATWFCAPDADSVDTAEIEQLLAARFAAQSARDFETADRIRDQLAAIGVEVQDCADGLVWERVGQPPS